jgi:hypothetical protein
VALVLPIGLAAQEAREVVGVVERVLEGGRVGPVAGAEVVLHRVGRDAQGALDSVRTNADGLYRFRYTTRGDTGAVYFASTIYAGVAYFTGPLREAVVRDETARLVVYDTASTDVPIATRGRHVIISALDSVQQRTVIEVFEVENTGARTRVANERAASWTARLPEGATDIRVGDGDIAPDAIAIVDGQVQVFAPISPGLRQLSFSYLLPEAAFPWSVPVTDSTDVLEVLVEDPAATVVGAGLEPQAAVMLDGRGFQRFLAQDVAAGMVATVTMPERTVSTRTLYVVAVVGLVGLGLLVGFARAMRRPASAGVPAPARSAVDPAEALATRIAALDARVDASVGLSGDERQQIQAERDALKAQLAAILAQRAGRV